LISKSFLKQFSLFSSVTRLFNGISFMFVALGACASEAVQLENWRFPFYQTEIYCDGWKSSPSGMFWDDFGASRGLNPMLWPDSSRYKADHWIVEPQVAYQAKGADTLFIDNSGGAPHYVNNRSLAQSSQVRGPYWTGQLLNDIRYKRVLLRQVLDINSFNGNNVEFHGNTSRASAGRIAEAYCQIDWKYGFFRLGRLNRNWGPFPDRSLLLSSNTQSYDAFEFQLFSSLFEFRHMFAAFPYDQSGTDALGNSHDRYLTAHALNIMLPGIGTVGLMETYLFARNSGLPDLQLVNPFSLYSVVNENYEAQGNLMLGLQWDLRPDVLRRFSLKGQIILDDFQVDNNGPADQEPTHWGIDVGAYLTDVVPVKYKHVVSLEYRYASRWLYTVAPSSTLQGERYSYLGRSIGEPANDGDRLNVSIMAVGGDYWTAGCGLSLTRQGANSIWSMWKNISKDSLIAPNELGYRTESVFPSGIVERTTDAYIELRAYYKNYSDISLRVDNRWINNKNNVRSATAQYDPLFSFSLSLHYCDMFVRLP